MSTELWPLEEMVAKAELERQTTYGLAHKLLARIDGINELEEAHLQEALCAYMTKRVREVAREMRDA